MAFEPTNEQRDAIYGKGNILVSAAAGSGKTAVLVERVIQKLCAENGSVSADKLLIVTFTNAAAAEMRTRIEKRLDEEIRKKPNDISLSLQKHLLSSAKICTVDSFCIDLVRENFERLGIAPDFKMSDGKELEPVNETVLSAIVNRYLEGNDGVFAELLDIVGSEYDEKNFISLVMELFDFSRQMPFPREWFKSLSDFYNNGKFTSDSVWWKYAFCKADKKIEEALSAIDRAAELITVNEKAAESYGALFLQTKNLLTELNDAAKTGDWDTLYNALNAFSLPDLPSVRGLGDIFEVTAAKSIYKYISDKCFERVTRIFCADNQFINSQFEKLYRPLSLLSDILTEFEEKLFEEYKQLNIFTFHNTEHMALSLLCEEKNGKAVIKKEAEELLGRFEEVMVDEYQDTNNLQDMLFNILSNDEKNLFVVGDVKQSIYGFRGANPINFLQKKNRYIPKNEANEAQPQKIILGNNFRCKPEVCDFINYFFKLFMSEETGEIIYNGEEKLIPAAEYPILETVPTEYHLIDSKKSEFSDNILEARHIAQIIRKIMNDGDVIRVDKNTLRRAEYSDFTILLRSAKKHGPILAEELKKQGIPASFGVEGFLESTEVAVFISLLSVIDNPQSDIELTSTMMSPIFGFTADEMARLRIAKSKGSLYSTVVFSAENGNEKAQSFLKAMEKYRRYAVTNTIGKLISRLLTESGYLDIVSAMPDGIRRRNNLLLLCDYAKQYENGGNSSVGGFVRYIVKQSASGIKSAAAPTSGDSVKIMSIHGSKGLQFPVCIVAGISRAFNDDESRDSLLYSTEFGIGFKYFDEDLKTRLTTVSREAILEKIRSDRLEEELRLLYVAMTRTQDRLILCGSVSDIESTVKKKAAQLIASDCKIDSGLFSQTKSYGDWLMLSLLLHPCGASLRGEGHSLLLAETDSKIDVCLISAEAIPDNSSAEDKREPVVNTELFEAITENLSYGYPYKEILNIEAKASVSKLANSAESAKYAFSYTPAFLQEGGITPTERGTAMHKVMQFFDFEKFGNPEAELERLYEWQFISEREYRAIRIETLKSFFNSAVFRRMKNSPKINREMRFLTEIPVLKIAPYLSADYSDEKVIVQGAVDICFAESDGLVILDFKTDRVDNAESLKESYSEQLNIYALACEKIFEMPVKQKIIYSFALSQEIEV